MNTGGRYKAKQIQVKARTPIRSTLDATHNNRVKYFRDLKKSLPSKKRELNQKQKRLDFLVTTSDHQLNDNEMEEKHQLRVEIEDLNQTIKNIENDHEELDYYLKAGQILFQYYENLEQTPKTTNKAKNKKQQSTQHGKSVVDFFTLSKSINTSPSPELKIEDPKQPDHLEIESSIMNPFGSSQNEMNFTNKPNSPNRKPSTWDGFVTKKDKFQRATLYEDYLSSIDPNFVKSSTGDIQEEYYCHDCGEYRLIDQGDACMVCPKCANSVPILLDSDKPNFKDVPVEICYFAYKRMNHFNECLSQFQAKESTEIPQEVYDTILLEMKKERNTNLASLTRKKVKAYLKKHANKRFNKYYEHIPHIINRLNGLPPKTMTPKMEEELRMMFRQMQTPFEKHRPKDRKNFLNYNYVLHKLCQLKGWDQFLTCFPLLKSKDKLYQQDKIWRNICADLSWEYIASR